MPPTQAYTRSLGYRLFISTSGGQLLKRVHIRVHRPLVGIGCGVDAITFQRQSDFASISYIGLPADWLSAGSETTCSQGDPIGWYGSGRPRIVGVVAGRVPLPCT